MKEKKLKMQENIVNLLKAMQTTKKKLMRAFAADVLMFDGTEGAAISRSQFFSRNSNVLNRFNEPEACKETLRIDVDKLREPATIYKITFCKVVGKQIENQQTLFYEGGLKAGFIEDKVTSKFYTFSYNEHANKITNIGSKGAKQQQIKEAFKDKA